ncbi:unnamed protein product [Lymnaea stagnalis]|uniref:Uncharacterized protein n=1 Tax=Lymnaea stagnalis TaxID=6523 RepID=A0AAV2I4M4_LYMST
MASFLIDRHSPMRTGMATKLRHRSRHSESDSFSPENPSAGAAYEEDQISPEKEWESKPNFASFESDQPCSEKRNVRSKSMLGYFMTELTRDYKLEGDASEFVERRDRVYTSVNTPKNLEKFCAFGFLQCLDSILYMVTFLPLRIIVALVRVLTYPFAVLFIGERRMLDGAQICDLLKGLILVISCFITSYMDMSMIYHIVRGQSIIKFYVFYNMLDVMDKLVSGFGQDVLDSLYWTAVEPRGRRREHFGTIFHLIFAIAYVVVHTVMILIQAIILNVAFNSHNKNLLTIMMSNNFVEIKGNLFKRLDKNNLCQITYGDVKERFHYLVLLLFVFIRNMKELQWSWDMAFPIIQDAAIVMLVEVVVDWIKHGFITKFNELSASSYADFALGLAQDIATSQKKHAFTNFSDQVCRRMGFTPMPLICLLFMVCTKSFNIDGPLPWLLVGLFYFCLMSTKVLNSIILLGWAQRLITERDKSAQSTGTVVNSQVIPKKEEKSSSAKAKTDVNPDLLVPNSSTPTRPTPVASSVAVNTDPLLYQDVSGFMSMCEPNEHMTSSLISDALADGDLLVSAEGHFQLLHDNHQLAQNEITSDDDSLLQQSSSSLHSVLKSGSDDSTCSSNVVRGDGADISYHERSTSVHQNQSDTDMGVKHGNYVNPSSNHPNSTTPPPPLFRSTSLPVKLTSDPCSTDEPNGSNVTVLNPRDNSLVSISELDNPVHSLTTN